MLGLATSSFWMRPTDLGHSVKPKETQGCRNGFGFHLVFPLLPYPWLWFVMQLISILGLDLAVFILHTMGLDTILN